jgi:hippurate hydrolase
VGTVVAEVGPLAASADNFRIELLGSGAHAARPHEARDPIVGAASLVAALQTIVSRRLDPSRAAVVTVGTINAGSAPNVIPDRAVLTGTMRATDPDTRRLLHEGVRRMAEGVAATHRLEARVEIELGPPPIVNPAEPTKWARAAAESLLGPDGVVPLGFMNLAGEDFAYYMERIPGCFLRVGAREPGGPPIPAHTPRFYAADEAIFVGAAVLAEAARVTADALGG